MWTTHNILVKERNSFYKSYANLCVLSELPPLPTITDCTPDKLDVYTDEFTVERWSAILISLSRDKSLAQIGIRCKTKCDEFYDHVDDEHKARLFKKKPLLHTNYVLTNFVIALNLSLKETDHLKWLTLDGLQLGKEYINIIFKGIAHCKSIEIIVFNKCLIKDCGMKILCDVMQSVSNVLIMELTQCGVSSKGGAMIGELVRVQKRLRGSGGWTSDKGYGEENFQGLKRINLSHNVGIGDDGVMTLMDAMKSNNWMKAIDLQDCNLTDIAACKALEMLMTNNTISVVDLRANAVSQCLLRQINKTITALPTESNYDWRSVEKNLPRKLMPIVPPSMTGSVLISPPSYASDMMSMKSSFKGSFLGRQYSRNMSSNIGSVLNSRHPSTKSNLISTSPTIFSQFSTNTRNPRAKPGTRFAYTTTKKTSIDKDGESQCKELQLAENAAIPAKDKPLSKEEELRMECEKTRAKLQELRQNRDEVLALSKVNETKIEELKRKIEAEKSTRLKLEEDMRIRAAEHEREKNRWKENEKMDTCYNVRTSREEKDDTRRVHGESNVTSCFNIWMKDTINGMQKKILPGIVGKDAKKKSLIELGLGLSGIVGHTREWPSSTHTVVQSASSNRVKGEGLSALADGLCADSRQYRQYGMPPGDSARSYLIERESEKTSSEQCKKTSKNYNNMQKSRNQIKSTRKDEKQMVKKHRLKQGPVLRMNRHEMTFDELMMENEQSRVPFVPMIRRRYPYENNRIQEYALRQGPLTNRNRGRLVK